MMMMSQNPSSNTMQNIISKSDEKSYINNGHSPQPQIRIRTEHYPNVHSQIPLKPKPTQDLVKFEQNLMNQPQSHANTYHNNPGPQNGSAT